MKCVNTFKICITFESIFSQFYKIRHDKIPKCKIDQWMNSEIKFTYHKIHPFKVYNSVHVSRYAELNNYNENLVLEYFYHPKMKSLFCSQ